ncbi:MAG: alanine racemase [Firmicutes bacterium]|nr:alanine racemase [Bacillota bacterium]
MDDGRSLTGEDLRWIEVDHARIAANVRAMKSLLGPASLWAVVKAQGYGHGAVEVARTALAAGAAGLAVASVEEGVELRQAGIEAPVLVLTPAQPAQARSIARHRLTAALSDMPAAEALAAAGRSLGEAVPVHVKVDTGMGRFGVLPEDAVAFVRRARQFSGLAVEGAFTHLAAADEEDLGPARVQLARFSNAVRDLEREGLKPPLVHCANSAAAVSLPESRFDLARVGIALYGLYPSDAVRRRAKAAGIVLQPAMTFRARVLAVRQVPAGWTVGYGHTFVASRPTVVATLAAGYAAGLARGLSHKGEVLLAGQRRPIIGRICMNHCMVDAGDLPVRPGDVATLLGADGGSAVTAEDWAGHLGTIPYEVVCLVGGRNPRRHLAEAAAGNAS